LSIPAKQGKILENDDLEHKTKDSNIKKIFKKIALKIHPDKLESQEDNEEKSKNNQLYELAIKALQNEDIAILIDIALKLNLNVEVTEDIIKKTEESISLMKKEINQIQKTYAWAWFFAKDEESKQKILDNLFKIVNDKNK
jgi:preprotein translocase subunit Sec63